MDTELGKYNLSYWIGYEWWNHYYHTFTDALEDARTLPQAIEWKIYVDGIAMCQRTATGGDDE